MMSALYNKSKKYVNEENMCLIIPDPFFFKGNIELVGKNDLTCRYISTISPLITVSNLFETVCAYNIASASFA